MNVDILFEDKNIIVAYKPPGLATQTAQAGQPDMVSELKKYLAGCGAGTSPYLGVVHRLDQPVEGLLAFGKTKQAAAGLSAQLAKGILKKTYYGVVCGNPVSGSGELVDYLAKEGNLAKVVSEEQDGAKSARLRYRILQSIQGTGRHGGNTDIPVRLHLAEIYIGTGRFHQIRVQMSHAGLPILGDAKYGNRQTAELGRQLGIQTVALCAYRLECDHPITGKKLIFARKPRNEAFSYFQIPDIN